MTATAIDVSTAILYYGTAAEILALTPPRGTVAFAEVTQDEYTYTTEEGWVKTRSSTDGAAHIEPNKLAMERNVGTSNEYGVSVPECNYHVWAHGDGDVTVSAVPALLLGVLVTVDIAGTTAKVLDGTADIAAGGTLVLSIPAGITAGTFYEMPGAKLNDGIFIEDDATGGGLIVFWRAQ
jgi:hypothetical protein